MKRFLVTTIILALLSLAAMGQGARYFLSFYLPVQPEVDAYFNLYRYLDDYNNDPQKDADSKNMTQLIDLSLKYDNLQSYLLDAFFRSTPNKKAQSFYSTYLSSKGINDKNADIVEQCFAREPIKSKDGSIRYQLANGKVAEDINLFKQTEIVLFDKRLHSQIFDNDYHILGMKDDPTFLTYMCGGGTNAFSASYRIHSLDREKFINQVEKKDFYDKRYSNWVQYDLPVSGVLKLANADQIAIGFGSRLDEFGDKEGEAVLFLYSDKYQQGYEITWMMNFSKGNVFFDNPERIWTYMSEVLLFTWID